MKLSNLLVKFIANFCILNPFHGFRLKYPTLYLSWSLVNLMANFCFPKTFYGFRFEVFDSYICIVELRFELTF